MASIDTTRFNEAMDRIEADEAIYSTYLTGSRDTLIPVEGGNLMTLKGVEARLLQSELDANQFVVQISEKMDGVVITETETPDAG